MAYYIRWDSIRNQAEFHPHIKAVCDLISHKEATVYSSWLETIRFSVGTVTYVHQGVALTQDVSRASSRRQTYPE